MCPKQLSNSFASHVTARLVGSASIGARIETGGSTPQKIFQGQKWCCESDLKWKKISNAVTHLPRSKSPYPKEAQATGMRAQSEYEPEASAAQRLLMDGNSHWRLPQHWSRCWPTGFFLSLNAWAHKPAVSTVPLWLFHAQPQYHNCQ